MVMVHGNALPNACAISRERERERETACKQRFTRGVDSIHTDANFLLAISATGRFGCFAMWDIRKQAAQARIDKRETWFIMLHDEPFVVLMQRDTRIDAQRQQYGVKHKIPAGESAMG